MRVLVVEDEIDLWISLQTFLAHRGDYAYWASQAAQGVRWLMHEPIDLVLVDVDLGPGEPSGLEVVRIMIADERLRKIPRIVISGMQTHRIREVGRLETVDVLQHVHPVILGKPLDLADLEHEIERAMKRAGR